MTMINPLDHEEAYDHVILGGVRSPGQLRKITGHDRKIGWDIKKGPGQSGASMTRTSEDPVPFELEFFLASREDFDAWPAFRGLIDSTVSGPVPKALDIYHPDLVENLITSVVKDTSFGTQHDGLGGQVKKIRLIEYKPAKAKGGSPSGSSSKPKSKANPDPNDPNAAALAELARLTDEYARTPWG